MGVLLAQTRCYLNLAMDRIIVRDEPADEPDDDGRRFCGSRVPRDRASQNDLARGENGRKKEGINGTRKKHPAEYGRANHLS